MKARCWDCDRKRDLFRPVFRRCDGKIESVCKQCWREGDYDLYMRKKDR